MADKTAGHTHEDGNPVSLITEHLGVWSSAVKTRSSTGRGSSKKIELYGIKKLRELILELAVRGLLVEQDSGDEPASVLLEKIAMEKAQLIKDKKIKKTKPLPEINDDEKNFVLPIGWSWTKLGDLVEMYNGRAFKSSEWVQEGIPIVRIQNLNDDTAGFNYFDGELAAHNRIDDNSFLISWSGTPGTSFGAFIWIRGDAALNQHINNCIFHYNGIDLEFMRLAVNGCMNHFISMAQGAVGLKHVTKGTLNNAVFGYPPLAEQHRIVAKVDELMALCDQLEQQQENSISAHQTLVETLLTALTNAAQTINGAEGSNGFAGAWTRIAEHFDTLFTTEHSIDQLKQTLLQLAIMGKLVPQNPNDEPASLLLEKIAAEKEQLIKDKKIKKQKPLPPISNEEKSFGLPGLWEWVRFGVLIKSFTNGLYKKSSFYSDSGVISLRMYNIQNGEIDFTDVRRVNVTDDELNQYFLEAGDLLINRVNSKELVGRRHLSLISLSHYCLKA